MKRVYVASSWRNPYQPHIVKLLTTSGHSVYDFRNPHSGDNGFSWKEIDPGWKLWSVINFKDALCSSIAERGYQNDIVALDIAEVVVLLLPSGRSAHTEAGYFKGKGGVVIVHIPEPCEPELMYKMFNVITTDDVELLKILTCSLSELRTRTLARV